MLEDLEMLIALQRIDDQLMDIEDEKGDLPEQLKALQAEQLQLRKQIDEQNDALGNIEALEKEKNQMVEATRAQLKKSQGSLYTVKTTREYDAISSEIEQAKSHIEEGDRQLIELMARGEAAASELAGLKEKLSAVSAELEERHSEMQDRLNVSKEDELSLRHEREKIVVRLKKPVNAHYDRIRKLRDGVGVSYLEGHACSYCFSMIPPQRQVEIRKMDELILCESCGCIIVGNQQGKHR